DINPLINPYVNGTQVLPKEGKPYADRNSQHQGMIQPEGLVYKLFEAHGWDWGGHWLDVQDYQHFEKRANGEKRNPRGYTHDTSR
ncbi:MAG TPA: M15 family metallopeptidase, partial [Candidatus Berkiella sp.]|nr:M15 family metallopeptidase [Candidatus Berkiella sp.]